MPGEIMDNTITVVTLTRKRVNLLKKAIVSIQNQDYTGAITHLVIVDECPATSHYLETNSDLPDNLVWRWVPREENEQPGPGRLAKLRNYAVREAHTRWISFLDDDNEFEPNHLSSLVSCIQRTGFRAVHSYRQLFFQDSQPYIEPRLPWWRDQEEGRRIYLTLAAKGVFQIGSNIARDRADPWDHPDPVRTVDMGEWLFERTLLLEHSFRTEYHAQDWAAVTTEDDKLMGDLIQSRIAIACSGLPTLKYYLGGNFNSLCERESGVWITEDESSAS
jgi:Glycosyl transferase family 2